MPPCGLLPVTGASRKAQPLAAAAAASSLHPGYRQSARFDEHCARPGAAASAPFSPSQVARENLIVRHHGDDDIGMGCGFLRSGGNGGAFGGKGLGALTGAIVDGDGVAGLQQAAGHACAHVAQTYYGDGFHVSSPALPEGSGSVGMRHRPGDDDKYRAEGDAGWKSSSDGREVRLTGKTGGRCLAGFARSGARAGNKIASATGSACESHGLNGLD